MISGLSWGSLGGDEVGHLLKRTKLGCMAFSPMDAGLLTPQIPDEPALADLAIAIDEVAAGLDTSRAAVCVAWVLHQGPTSVLAGTRLILSDAVLAELSQARRTYRLSQQETD